MQAICYTFQYRFLKTPRGFKIAIRFKLPKSIKCKQIRNYLSCLHMAHIYWLIRNYLSCLHMTHIYWLIRNYLSCLHMAHICWFRMKKRNCRLTPASILFTYLCQMIVINGSCCRLYRSGSIDRQQRQFYRLWLSGPRLNILTREFINLEQVWLLCKRKTKWLFRACII